MDIFNDRFNFPFELTIENQSDIILKEVNTPMVKFLPKKGEEKSENEIQDFLSSGEKRALYLLKILFNLKVQENEFNNSPSDSSRKLLIFDDIADSFDYQNKYAIIEYLKEISEKDAFNMMILTHNFDFFRTVKQAIPSKTYIAYKDSKSEEINLKKCHIEENLFKL